MNGYVCFYRGQRIEVRANTSLQAQQAAAKQFKIKRMFEVTVMLAEKDGQPVIHTPTD